MRRNNSSFAPRSLTTPMRQSHSSSLSLIHVGREDTLDTLLTVLCQQDQPVVLILPEDGTVLSQPDHFLALWRLLTEQGHPPSVHLVIQEAQSLTAWLASRFGFSHSASLEAALHALLNDSSSNTLPFHEGALIPPAMASFAPQPEQKRSFQDDAHPGGNLSPVPPALHSAPSRKGTSILLSALFGVLLVISVLFARLLLAVLPPPLHPVAQIAGVLTFTSSGQVDSALTEGYNDIITLTFSHTLPSPPAGMAYVAWLMPDPTDDATLPLLLGMLSPGATRLTYISPTHRNLLAHYSGVRVTEQPAHPIPTLPSQDPALWRWQGWIPNIPTPGDEQHYSLLSYLRHLLAADPILQAHGLAGGLAFWMTRNIAKVEEWASAGQGQWHGDKTSPDDAALIERQMIRMLDYLDGEDYVWHDVLAGSPRLVDSAGGKIGLINRVREQTPPAYLGDVALHVQGLAGAPGHTSAQQHLAVLVYTVIERMEQDLLRVRADASAVVRMALSQMRQPGTLVLLDEMALLTTQVASGWLDPMSGEDIGGSLWILTRLQTEASISLHPVSAQAREQ